MGMQISRCVSAALSIFTFQHFSSYVASGITAVAEYIAAEILEVSGNTARDNRKTVITVPFIKVQLLQHRCQFRYIGMTCFVTPDFTGSYSMRQRAASELQ
jgi:hypothetical protein